MINDCEIVKIVKIDKNLKIIKVVVENGYIFTNIIEIIRIISSYLIKVNTF